MQEEREKLLYFYILRLHLSPKPGLYTSFSKVILAGLLSKLLYHSGKSRDLVRFGSSFVSPNNERSNREKAVRTKEKEKEKKRKQRNGEKGNIIRWNRTHDLFGGGSRWEIRTRGMHWADLCPEADGGRGAGS